MRVKFVEQARTYSGNVAVLVKSGKGLLATAQALDRASRGTVARALKAAARFDGKKHETLALLAPAGIAADRLVLAGVGKPDALDRRTAEGLGGTLLADANGAAQAVLTIVVDPLGDSPVPAAELAAHIALGAQLRGYRFDKYRTKEKPEAKPTVTEVRIAVKNVPAATKAFAAIRPVAESVFFARDLVSEPANILYPQSYAQRIRGLARLGLKIQVLGEAEMKRLGMGSLLGVGQGSERESQLVVMTWRGGRRGQKPLAFIGKGVCFDTGGISLKPAGGMEDMKWDMGGSAAVVGAMRLLAQRKAKVNAVGVVALVENMPDGNAQRPGDVVTSMSGQTIEVINTDAEGRLILADAMWYAQEKFQPQLMVEFSTLTGAILIALGHERAGLFSNNTQLSTRLREAGQKVGEKLWRMPLGAAYDKLLKSEIADMRNVSGGRGAGSITAAQFLQRFVKDALPWAHIDIAGMAWGEGDATTPKGATAYGVRLLDQLVADHYER
jgi:leucyl aminopeptidase